MQVDAVGGLFPGVIDGDAVAGGEVGAGLDEGKEAVFAPAKDLPGVGLVEEAILPADGGVVEVHN